VTTCRRRHKLLLPVLWCIIALASLVVLGPTGTTAEDADQPSLAQVESSHAPPTARASTALAASQAFLPNPAVAAMLAQVQQSTLYTYTGQLSGEWPALIGGVPYTITTRYTDSGTPIQMATQYVYEHMQALSLTVSYHDWTYLGHSNRNAVGVLTGTTHPDEIVLVTAHLDDMPSLGLAPGADDNASGSAGVLVAADILHQYQFERTLRFVFFTGEEQWLWGSHEYAESVYNAGDNIVAVYNMDMIAWNSDISPTLWLHTRRPDNPGYAGDLAIAGVFTNVVDVYGLSGDLTPVITADGTSASDHSSFWNKGYSAILAIEDWNDRNEHYHTSNDRLQFLDMTYFTNYVKASVGTAAHLACPLQEAGILTGVVSDAITFMPIAGAQVQVKSGLCPTHTGISDSEGVYSLTLPVGVYSVTASASRYWPNTALGVVITSTAPEDLDMPLIPVRFTYMPLVFKNAL